MGINQKIEEIRQKPEHIRMRYVWGMVAVSMFVILAIWFFSFSLNNEKEKLVPVISDPNFYKDLESQKQNLEEYRGKLNSLGDQLQDEKSNDPEGFSGDMLVE